MKKKFFIFISLFYFGTANAQLFTYNATATNDPGDSCSHLIEINTTGFALPITYYINNGLVDHLATTANPLYECREEDQYMVGYDQFCHQIGFMVADNDTLTPPLYIKNVSFDMGGPSNCDNVLSFTIAGLQGPSMRVQLQDNDPIVLAGIYDNYIHDSTFTYSGFCLGDFNGDDEHSLAIFVWDSLTMKFCSWYLNSPPVSLVTGGTCSGVLSVKAYPIPASDMIICNGSVNALVTGDNPPFTYDYSNGPTTAAQTGMCAGMYQLSVTDALGYSRSTSILIADSTNIYFDNPTQIPVDTLIAGAYMNCNIDFSSPIDTIYIDSIVNLTPQVVRVTYIIEQYAIVYKWSETYYTDTAGYYCFITNVFCEVESRSSSSFFTAYMFGESMGSLGITGNIVTPRELTIYPNPTNNACYIKGLESDNKVVVYDLSGRVVLSISNSNGNISTSTLVEGVYVVKVTQKSGISTQKLVIKQ